jgi:hypothetical protein
MNSEKYSEKRSLTDKKDIIFIVALLVAAVVFYVAYNKIFAQNKDIYAEISVDGKAVKTVELYENQTFSLDDMQNITFDVKNCAIAFVHSDCPDKICVKTGYIKKQGQTAVCLPNKTTLKIVARDNDVDAVN